MLLKNGWRFGVAIFVIILLVVVSSGVASAAEVTYYFKATSGVDIGADGTTDGAVDQTVPPVIKEVLDTSTSDALVQSNSHPSGSYYDHSRWYLTFDYSNATQIDANPSGLIRLSVDTTNDRAIVSLYDYDSSTGAKTLIGSSSEITPTATTYTNYAYTISSSTYVVPANHRLMVQVEFNQASGTSLALISTYSSGISHITVTETPVTVITYDVTVTPTPTSAGVVAGGNYAYPITVYNDGNTAGSFTLVPSDSDSTNFSSSTIGTSPLYVTSGGSNSTTVTVTAQGGATLGAVDTTTVTVTSLDNSSYSNTTQVTTTVETAAPAVSVTLTPSSQTVSANSNLDYTVTVQNTGNTVDSYTLSINSANTADFGYTLASTSTGSLNPGQQYATTMTVYGLAGATADNTHQQSVTATGTASDTSNSVTTTVSDLPTILVATDRYVVLDDPISSGAQAQSPYVVPDSDWGSGDTATGKQTTIGIKSLVIDNYGSPIVGERVNFTIYYPDGSIMDDTGFSTSDSSGVASFYKDLNNEKFYGAWKVNAESGGISSSSSTFIYDWWGCSWSDGGACGNQHSGKGLDDNGQDNTPESPYTASYEPITGKRTDHNTGISNNGWADDFCTVCHQSYDGNPTTSSTEGSTTKDFTPAGSHSGIRCDNSICHDPGTNFASHNAGSIVIGSCSDCHSRSDITMKSTLNGAVSEYSNSSSGTYDAYHTSSSTVPCVICHGPMHNITKPDPTVGGLNANTEDSHCTTCHTSLSKHNDAVGCVECHSEDIHVIQYRQDDDSFASTTTNAVDCTDCHQGSGLASFSSAEKIAKISHSENTLNGSLWSEGRTGNFWTNSSEVSKCEYCHGDSKHMSSGVGKPAQFNGTSDIVGGDLTGAWCGLCHYQLNPKYATMISTMGSGYVPPEISGDATYGAYTDGKGSDGTTGYFNHGSSYTADSDCTGCHDGNGATTISQFMHNVTSGGGGPNCVACHNSGASVQHVDVSAMNDSTNIHAGLNSGAADTTGNSDNKMCWGCHQSDGAQPSGHPDKLSDPYTCYECHDGTPPSHASDALAVSNHFKSGTNLTSVSGVANNTASCLECHNKAEMMASYTEPDSINTTMSLVSHYGIKRTTGDLSNYNSSAYCVYCHNATNEFDALVTGINASITNHSNSVSSPSCANTTCHNSGRIHDISLKIPTVTPTLCKSCHTAKSEHNNSVACSDCHMTDDTQIHAIRFLQPDESFSTVSATAVNCTTCHQDGGLTNFSNATNVGMVRHSQNTLNGSLWDRGSAFWTNTSETSKCEYCHGDSKHDTSALGSVDDFKGSNTVDADLTGTWCAGCHYQDDANYNTMVATLSIVPPEITGNATYGDYTTADDGTTTYFDHSTISGFTDADCTDCHDKNASTMISPFMHNVSLNNGGTDCTACHDVGGPVTNVNISEIVNGSHSGMNSDADLTGVTNGTQLCWSCHGDGSRPEEHPSNYESPHYCDDCHTPANATGQNAPAIYRHAAGAGGREGINKAQLVCEDCHASMLTISSPTESTLAQVAHYTNNSPSTGWITCNEGCHKDPDLRAPYANADQTTMGDGSASCMYCHNHETSGNGFMSPPLGEGRNATDGSVSIHSRSIVRLSTARCDDLVCHGSLQDDGSPDNRGDGF